MYSNPATQKLVAALYKGPDGNPFTLSPSQNEIFDIIAARMYPRTHCMTTTQFGKSEVVSQAVLTRATTFPEKWTIVAPSAKKANIIMGYTIGHIFDNAMTTAKFEIGKDESVDRIRRERRKDHLTFRLADGGIGEILTISTEGRRAKDVLDAIMGFGSPNVVLDESSLTSDDQYAGVKRMLGGHKDNFLFEIGNPFRRNHFLRTSMDPTYHKLVVDAEQAVLEGRLSKEFLEEMRRDTKNKQLFDVLYNCKFPPEEAVDADGYSPLVTEEDLKRAIVGEAQFYGEDRLGVDVAGGGRNQSVIVHRAHNAARVALQTHDADTMSFTGRVLQEVTAKKVLPANVFPDTVGIGKGLCDRLAEQLPKRPTAVNFGETPEPGGDFINLRAQCYWRMAEWIKGGGKLVQHPGWAELLDVRYKVQSDRKVKIIGKDELARRGVESPDVADALALTFARAAPAATVKPFKQPEAPPAGEYGG